MKKNLILSVLLLAVVVAGCSCKKDNTTNTEDKTAFYSVTWELEYISGPRIAFAGLYPEEKPTITFSKDNDFGGNSSCNAYSGKYTKKDNEIKFGDAIKTMRFCEGGGEETFMNMLGKINNYSIDKENKLVLLMDDVPMMRFKKITKPQQ